MQGKTTLFFDTITNKVDSKGRVSVPADYRARIENGETELVAFRSFVYPCIECCTSDLLEKMAAGIEAGMAMFSQEQDELTSLIYADAKEFSFDSTGRIMLTPKLLAHAEITDSAVFVGKGRTFQIWNPENYAKEEARIRAKALKQRPILKLHDGEEG
ncbi:MAG: division/cell wall cluster transcriptional repressor MraZ [Alphaproteobacteria bacterium]|nr:division/cell wall cluster transcriptional repressor MraZ [Alphaproteobacteria bacterium]